MLRGNVDVQRPLRQLWITVTMRMQLLRRLVVITILSVAVLVVAHGGGGSTDTGPVGATGGGTIGVPPGFDRLTADQKLDWMVAHPGFRGLLEGSVTGSPTVHTLPPTSSTDRIGFIVSDYPFAVKAFVGKSASAYSPGLKITIRMPGGCGSGFCMYAAARPPIGREVFVVMFDEGSFLGGDTSTIKVVPSADDFYTNNNGVVSGRVLGSSLTEAESTFRQHFLV